MAKTIFTFMLLALLVQPAMAQKKERMSRKEEVAQLKQAYREASQQVENLSGQLAQQVREMDALVKQLNSYKDIEQQNARLKEELETANSQLAKMPQQTPVVPVALFFEIGKAELGAKELVNLNFYIENAIEANPNRIFTVMAIEDTSVGKRNKELAIRRANYVHSLLINKYGINPSRIINKGSVGEDLYENAKLNRVVIIK